MARTATAAILTFAAQTNAETVKAQAAEISKLTADYAKLTRRLDWLIRNVDSAVILDSRGSYFRLIRVFETGDPREFQRLSAEYVLGLATAHTFCRNCERNECEAECGR
jgi:hypothetical protein